jgi:O-antigen/teichoic acid export membrane protein
MAKRADGIVAIGGATIVAGIAGYAVTLLVYRVVGASAYAIFAVFWAALFLLVGGLNGIQQEITRATFAIPPGTRTRPSRARNLGVVVAAGVFILVLVTALAWNRAVFATEGWALVFPLAVGAASYVLVAVLGGSLYGVSHWRSIALMVASDGILRVLLVGIGLLFTHDVIVLAWLVALPFPLVIALLWPLLRRGFVGRTDVDAGYRQLSWNALRAVVASISTAVLVSGFPLLLGVTAHGQPAALVGELIFAITLTRAPLIVSVMALQSYFVVRFRDGGEGWVGLFWRVIAIVGVAAVVLAGLGWWLGRPVIEWISGHPTPITGGLVAILVASSALVGAMCVTGPAVLAHSRHSAYTAGWVAAAVATIVVMASPIEFMARVAIALLTGPFVGLVVHLVALTRSARRGTVGSSIDALAESEGS